MTREPAPVAILAARIMRAYPDLSAWRAARFATTLSSIGRAWELHSVRACNGPREIGRRPDRGEVFGYHVLMPLKAGQSQDPRAPKGQQWVHDPESENKARERIQRRAERWLTELSPPAGKFPEWHWDLYLKVRLPGEAEAVAV